MNTSETISLLKEMRMTPMANEFRKQIENPEDYRNISFEDRLGMLVDAEWANRQANKLKRCINGAHFSCPSAAVEDIEYFEDRKLNKTQILHLAKVVILSSEVRPETARRISHALWVMRLAVISTRFVM